MITSRFGSRKSKYRAIKTKVDGITFDSRAEACFYNELLFLQKAGEINIIELQPKVYLTEARILIKPDFLIEENGKKVWIDVKGHTTAVFQIKVRLWSKYGPGTLRLVKKNGFRFDKIKEIISEGEV